MIQVVTLRRRKGDLRKGDRRNSDRPCDSGISRRADTQSTGFTEDSGSLHDWDDLNSRRLEDKIRDLCHKALDADPSQTEEVFAELRTSLHEHAERLRKMMAVKLGAKEHEHGPERRSF
jgi:hypothetical protein